MTLRIDRGPDAPLTPLRDRTVAVLGYGSQGSAHASNLRDSGIDVVVGQRPGGTGARRAAADGFDPRPLPEAAAAADLAIVALPDEVHASVLPEQVLPHLRAGAVLGFLHGLSIHYGLVDPPPGIGIVMIAPKGPGATLRERYVEGLGIPCLLAVHRDESGDAEPVALAWAAGIGCARAGIIHTTFGDEAETDMFGEQSVLCGGLVELIVAAFEILVDEGYPPELAYLECCHEVKQIADLVYRRGLAATMDAISNTAELGAAVAGPRIIDEEVRKRMRELLGEIRDGTFVRALQQDHAAGFPRLREARRRLASHPIEPAGDVVRGLMPWPAEDPAAPETAP